MINPLWMRSLSMKVSVVVCFFSQQFEMSRMKEDERNKIFHRDATHCKKSDWLMQTDLSSLLSVARINPAHPTFPFNTDFRFERCVQGVKI